MSAQQTSPRPEAVREPDALPLDIATMRTSARRLLAEDAQPLGADELDTYLSTLRGHMRLLIPEVEQAAERGPDDIPKYCALACVGEARRKVDLVARGVGYGIPYARRLARSVNALCDHCENLGGVTS